MAARKRRVRKPVTGARRPKRVRFACSLFVVIMANLLVSAQISQAPKLNIGAVSINGNAGEVTFRATYSDQSAPSVEAVRKHSYETPDQKYIVVVDPDKIAPVSFGDFTFLTSVKRESDETWYSYDVVASPKGSFADVQKEVSFTIGQEGQATVNIKLPLHSANYDDALQWIKDDAIAEIGVSASQGPVITLKNSLEGLDIHITKVAVVYEKCPECWQEAQQQSAIDVNAGGKVYPVLNIRPKPLSALWSTASTLKPGATQDVLSVVVDYNVDDGGGVKHLPITLPIRFSPSFWHLAIVVVAGALLGIGLAAVLARLKQRTKPAGAADTAQAGQSAKSRKSPWATVGQILMTIFLSVVAVRLLVLLASRDSKLVILGFDLDPRQMIPAFVVAALIAGGSPVKTFASGILGWGQGKVSGAAADGDGD